MIAVPLSRTVVRVLQYRVLYQRYLLHPSTNMFSHDKTSRTRVNLLLLTNRLFKVLHLQLSYTQNPSPSGAVHPYLPTLLNNPVNLKRMRMIPSH